MRSARVLAICFFTFGTGCTPGFTFETDAPSEAADAGGDGDTMTDGAPGEHKGPDGIIDPTGCDVEHPPLDDVKNCGACGHDCLGSTCQEGLCTPTVFLESQPKPFAIAADDQGVYFTNLGTTTKHGGLLACEGSPCDAQVIVDWSPPAPEFRRVAITQTLIVAMPNISTDDSSLATSWAYQRTTHASASNIGGHSPLGLFADPAGTYFLIGDSGRASNQTDAYLLKCSPSGGGLACPLVTVVNPAAYGLVAAAGTRILTTSSDRTAVYSVDNVNSIASGHAIVDFVSDGADVWWLSTHTQPPSIWRCAGGCASGGPSKNFATRSDPRALAADSTGVYWLNGELTASTGSIEWAKPGAGAPVVIARNLQNPQRIALTTDWIYVTEPDAGKILRLPKPK